MTVDGLGALHLEASHLFVEEAPGDLVADLGLFGADPGSRPSAAPAFARTSPTTWRSARTRATSSRAGGAREHRGRGHLPVRPRRGAQAVAGRARRERRRMGAAPADRAQYAVAARHYEGPGHSLAQNALHLADLGATELGRLVCGTLEQGEAAIAHLVDRALGLDG